MLMASTTAIMSIALTAATTKSCRYVAKNLLKSILK
jgi:hypothetical protein